MDTSEARDHFQQIYEQVPGEILELPVDYERVVVAVTLAEADAILKGEHLFTCGSTGDIFYINMQKIDYTVLAKRPFIAVLNIPKTWLTTVANRTSENGYFLEESNITMKTIPGEIGPLLKLPGGYCEIIRMYVPDGNGLIEVWKRSPQEP